MSADQEERDFRAALLVVLDTIRLQLQGTRELQTQAVQEAMFEAVKEQFMREMGGPGLIVPKHLAER